MKPIVSVACGIIVREGKVLCAQRGVSQDLAFLWEFPGGKLELGETAADCLLREIKEELNLEIEILKALTPQTHLYASGVHIQLIPYLCRYVAGELLLIEHSDIRWLAIHNLLSLPWCEADIPIVEELVSLSESGTLNLNFL